MYNVKSENAKKSKFASIKRNDVNQTLMSAYMNNFATQEEKVAFKAAIKEAREQKGKKYLDEVKKKFLEMFYDKQKKLFEDTF